MRLRLGDASFEYPVVNGRQIGTDAFHDSVDLAIGFELRPPGLVPQPGCLPIELTIRFGYKFSQNHISPSAGPSALLDSDTHAGAFGVGLVLPAQPVLKGPLKVDWGIQVQRIMPMELPKTTEGIGSTLASLPVAYSAGARWPGGFALVSGLSLALRF